MRRLGIAWALAASLAALGSLWAHELTYRLAAPSDSAYASLLARTGHGYLDHAPLLVGILLAAVALSLVRACLDGARGRRSRPGPGWRFAVLPVVGFALQEHLERLFHDGTFPLGAALESTFLLGVVLQLPFEIGHQLGAVVRQIKNVDGSLAFSSDQRNLDIASMQGDHARNPV